MCYFITSVALGCTLIPLYFSYILRLFSASVPLSCTLLYFYLHFSSHFYARYLEAQNIQRLREAGEAAPGRAPFPAHEDDEGVEHIEDIDDLDDTNNGIAYFDQMPPDQIARMQAREEEYDRMEEEQDHMRAEHDAALDNFDEDDFHQEQAERMERAMEEEEDAARQLEDAGRQAIEQLQAEHGAHTLHAVLAEAEREAGPDLREFSAVQRDADHQPEAV